MRWNCSRLAIFALVAMVSAQMVGQSYTYQSIDFPGAQETYVYGINNAGDIVGGYRSAIPGPEIAWKRVGGTFSTVSMPSYIAWSQAQGINDSGHIVGQYESVSGRFGFIIDALGFHIVEKSGAYDTYALDITNAGTVVGNYDDTAGTRGFVYSNAVLTPIVLPNTLIDSTHMARIGGTNSTGSVTVGGYMVPNETHAFVWSGETVQFVDYPGSTLTSFEAVNDSNQIVGYTSTHGVLYSGGTWTIISYPGAMWGTMPTGINNKGQIVGVYYDGQDRAHGFVATPECLTPSFENVVKNGVSVQPEAQEIKGAFTPNCGFTLTNAAQLSGFDHFNWLQMVTRDDVITKYPNRALVGGVWYEIETSDGVFDPTHVLPTIPFIDPPHFGYGYQVIFCSDDPNHTSGACSYPIQDELDWYWDEEFDIHYDRQHPTLIEYFSDPTSLTFYDAPSSPCVPRLLGQDCTTVEFKTSLVAVKGDGTGRKLEYPGTEFTWSSTADTVGAPHILSNFDPTLANGVIKFKGFVLPGSDTQQELELLARSGIEIQGAKGVVKPVIIDIKPHYVPNSINPRGQGTIPVGIISTKEFHATSDVVPGSFTFGRTGNEESFAYCHSEDLNGDGLMDLVCHFYIQRAGFQSGDTTGILRGETLSGLSLLGKDAVRIVPPR